MSPKLAIALTVLLLSVGCRNALVMLYFYGNQDHIAKNFCVNRDRPELKCNGKCYLTKQLHQDKKEQREKLPLVELIDYVEPLAWQNLNLSSAPHYVSFLLVSGKAIWPVRFSLYQSDYYSKLLQPPEVRA